MRSPASIALAWLTLGFTLLACKSPTTTYVYESKDIFEAFGRRKPNVSSPLFLLTDDARKNIPKEKLAMFIRAQNDIDLITSNQEPIFCQIGFLTDGGTKIYSCSDYVITHWSEIRKIDGLHCTKRGISIKFNTPNLGMNKPFDDVSHTWIEFWSKQP